MYIYIHANTLSGNNLIRTITWKTLEVVLLVLWLMYKESKTSQSLLFAVRSFEGKHLDHFISAPCRNNFTWLWFTAMSSAFWRMDVGMACLRVPFVVQQDQRLPLGSVGMHIQSLAWHSALRIWRCHNCSLGCDCDSELIPGLGAPHAAGQPKKKKKKK